MPKKRVHEKWQWEIFLHSSLISLETCVCFKKSSEFHKGSLCFTVVSFFPRSSTQCKAGTHRVEMDSLVPKERMWNFWGANMRRGFLWVSAQENKAQHTARRLSLYWETLKTRVFGGGGGNLTRCVRVPAFLFYYTSHGECGLLKETKTVVSMNRNEDRLNRPVYALRSVLSSATTKPLRIPACFSDFCPQEGQKQKKKRKTSVVFFLYVELFSTAAHTDSAWGTGL